MKDTTIIDVPLNMRKESLADLSGSFALPDGYGFRLYAPGDEAHWGRIEASAGEFGGDESEAPRAFQHSFQGNIAELERRMYFLTAPDGNPVGTATAWFDPDGTGRLHWVAIEQAHQNKGLSRPLIFHALSRLRELKHESAVLGTQPPSWVAIRIYYEMGFRPVFDDTEDCAAGWRAVQRKLPGIPFLQGAPFGAHA